MFRGPLVGDAVRGLRARGIERSYAKVVRHYATRPPVTRDVASLLRQRRGARAYRPAVEGRPPRVLWIGTDEAQDRSGFIQALGGASELTIFTQENGRYGQLSERNELSFERTRPNARRLLALLESARGAGRPFDLVIGQMWGGYTDPAALRSAAADFGCFVLNIAMDDRHAYRKRKLGRAVGTGLLIPSLDLALTTAPEAVDWYLAEGCPALFFPEASDPRTFGPMPDLPKVYDVSFVGMRYGIRESIVGAIRRSGVNVAAWGNGWELGRLPLDRTPTVFAQSRIVLGVGTVGHSTRLLSLKLRDFDGPMSGSCYLTLENPDLHTLYEIGTEIVTYGSPDGCVREVKALLLDETRREEIARRGRARALHDHTWDARVTGALRFVEDALSNGA